MEPSLEAEPAGAEALPSFVAGATHWLSEIVRKARVRKAGMMFS
jgi:hypothetical protein